MQIKLNNGIQIDIPIIESGSPTKAISNYTFTNEPIFYYKRGYDVCNFGVLSSFMDELDALNNPYPNGETVYQIVYQGLSNFHHELSYYTTGTGKTYIDNLLAHGVWVMGSFDTGGIMMVKVSNKYAFVSWQAILTYNENPDMYIYNFGCTCSGSGSSERGTFSKTELTNAALGWYTDISEDIVPLYIWYTPDGYSWAYVSSFANVLGEYTSIWTNTGTIQEAMRDSSYIQDILGDYYPKQPFLPYTGSTYDRTAGRTIIGGNGNKANYSRASDTNIYGGSKIDDDLNPYGSGGLLTTSGGGGKFSKNSDQGGWTEDDQFATDALNSGFFTLYNPTKGEVQSFNDFLFTDITDSMATQLKKLVSNPLDYVVFMSMCHFSPEIASGGKQPIKYCGIDSGVSANVVADQYKFIDCGTVYIDESDETGSYLSYNPYMTCHLYLPYIGMIEMNIDDVMDAYINVRYWIDLLTGSCIAQIISKRPTRSYGDTDNSIGIVIGEYTGNCYLNLPLSATDWRGLFSSVVQFAGGLTALAGGSASGLGSIASAVMTEKTHVSRSGQIGSNYGYMGYQKPYFLFERPVVAIPENWGEYEGYPSNMIDTLTKYKGYTEVEDDGMWTNGINGATDQECDLIRQVFAGGVLLNWEE